MFGENPLSDGWRFLRACLTNQIARLAPALYVKLTGQTGRRARDTETVDQIADYFERCFEEYFHVLQVGPPDAHLRDKIVLEYGPGDVPGVALLMLAHGAQKVVCIDRFPLASAGAKNIAVLQRLMDRLAPEARRRAGGCFQTAGNPASGFSARRLEYLIRANGLSGLRNAADLIVSRAVLEHVNDLSATFADMRAALCEGGMAIHLVDLKSHGLHRRNQLDFLTWPQSLWTCMHSHKGVPNRWRIDRYREVISGNELKTLLLMPTAKADPHDISEVRPHLARPFRHLSDEDLSWLGFWIVCSRG